MSELSVLQMILVTAIALTLILCLIFIVKIISTLRRDEDEIDMQQWGKEVTEREKQEKKDRQDKLSEEKDPGQMTLEEREEALSERFKRTKDEKLKKLSEAEQRLKEREQSTKDKKGSQESGSDFFDSTGFMDIPKSEKQRRREEILDHLKKLERRFKENQLSRENYELIKSDYERRLKELQ